MKHHGLWLSIKVLTLFSFLFLLAGIFSCEGKKDETSISKTNSPPVITSINILPEKPIITSELNLTIQSQDPDGDTIIYHYQWIKNDEEIIGENKNTLRSGNFKKGDLIRVNVIPSDGKTEGKPFLSAPVGILNSPPVVQEIWIEPKMAYANDQLKTIVKANDKDGDFIYFTYQWEKDEAVIPEEREEVLKRGLFTKGNSVTVTVTPDDREAMGSPKKSEPIIISNSPPIIVSSPPNSVEGMTYLYQVKANDPDNDRITFTLKSSPKGMEMNKDTGLIQWLIRKEDKGIHSIEIEAFDNEGAKSLQRYTLTVEFK